MLGWRIDFRTAIDGLLLAVPFILLCSVIPAHLARITVAFVLDRPNSDHESLLAVVWAASLVPSAVAVFATRFLFRPPLLVTPTKLVVILVFILVAMALAAASMMYVR